MATVTVDGPDLVVRLSWKEKLGAVHGDVRVPVSSVQAATVELTPWNLIRGVKFAGTGIPGRTALGVRQSREGKDFTAVHPDQPAVRIDLDEKSPYSRLIVSVPNPEDTVAAVCAAAGI
jgi:hypothetical protein